MSQTTTCVSQLRRYLAELSAMVDTIHGDDSIDEEMRSDISWEIIRLEGSITDAIASIAAMDQGDQEL